jgi:hypothetical protein
MCSLIASLHWITPCQGFALRITAESWRQIDRECSRSGAFETGGILVGHYTNDNSTAFVTEALLPPKDSSRSTNWFHRGVAGLKGVLAMRWKSEFRTFYIGEWHYHPSRVVKPSVDDMAQMHAINADPLFQCREPVMIIVGQGVNSGERPVRAFVFPSGGSVIEFEEVDKPSPT